MHGLITLFGNIVNVYGTNVISNWSFMELSYKILVNIKLATYLFVWPLQTSLYDRNVYLIKPGSITN